MRLTILFLLCLFSGCLDEENFQVLDLQYASPVAVAHTHVNGSDYTYVLNTDYVRTFNQGSLLILDSERTPQKAVTLPRLGRFMTHIDDKLIIIFSPSSPQDTSHIHMYSLSDPLNPNLIWQKAMDEEPVSVTVNASKSDFAVACQGGGLYVGAFDNENSNLQKVRDLPQTHRAMTFINWEGRDILLTFPTDLGIANTADLALIDKESLINEQIISGGNEFPDKWQIDLTLIRRKRLNPYQYMVYDYTAEKAKDPAFPFAEYTADATHTIEELRMMHFNLNNFDGTPDLSEEEIKEGKKYFRTNFWSAVLDPEDNRKIYLSHRGLGTTEASPHANNIVELTLLRTPLPDQGVPPKTSETFEFKRVWGYQSPDNDKHYPGDFLVTHIQGQKALVINNHRDLSHFRTPYFSIAVAWPDNPEIPIPSPLASTDGYRSYYGLAPTQTPGTFVTTSFYGNTLVAFEVGLDSLTEID